jgi:hypothetical protein
VRLLNTQSVHQANDIIALLFVAICRVIARNLRRRIATRVINDTPVIAAEASNLTFPGAVVGGKFVNPDDGIADSGFLVVKLHAIAVEERHGLSGFRKKSE